MYNDDFFNFQLDRKGTNTYKWDWSREQYGEDILPLFVADMDFRTVNEISTMLKQRAEHNTFGYTRVSDADYQAVIDFTKKHHGIHLQKEDISILPSVVTGIKLFIRTFSNEGEGIIIQTPVYGQFFRSIETTHRTIIENPLICDENNRYSMDLNHLEHLFKQGHRHLILCNPHNPVSRFWNEKELSALLELAKKYNVFICSDEIHADFVYQPNQFVSIMSVAEKLNYNRVLTLYAPSKTFNLAGLQLSYIFCKDKEFNKLLLEEKESCGVESGNIFGLIAAKAAFQYGEKWLQGLMNYLNESRKILSQELSQMDGLRFSPIEATYLAWLDLRQLGLSSEELTKRCLEHHVLFTEGYFFNKENGKGFLRFNFACPRENMYKGIERLKKIINFE